MAGSVNAGALPPGDSGDAVLAKGERVRLDAGVEDRDLEGAVGDRARLAAQLVEPRLDDIAPPLPIDVDAMGSARLLPVQAYAES